MFTKIHNKKVVLQLIEEYKALPSLWRVNCESYKSKCTKRADYNLLLNKMKLADPCLTMEELKKKIAKMRTCYRRELKKVSDSIKSGATGQDVYIPTLWYFDQINFLRDQEIKTKDQEMEMDIKMEPNAMKNFIREPADTSAVSEIRAWKSSPTQQFLKVKPKPAQQFEKSFVKKNTFVKKPVKRLVPANNTSNGSSKKDEAALFSETWALAFRKLSNEQQIYGKRCIDEVLYQGQLGKLTDMSYKCLELPLPSTTNATSNLKFKTNNNFHNPSFTQL